MYHLRGVTPAEVKGVQVECAARLLNSNDVFCIFDEKKRFVWQGKGVGVLNEYSNNRDKMINDFVVKILERYPPTSD